MSFFFYRIYYFLPTVIDIEPFYGFYLLLDKNNKGYLYGGDNPKYADGGGAYLSINAGKTFKRIGLDTLNVTSIALNNSSTKLYTACYGSGIWIADVPEIIDNRIRPVTNTNDSGEGSFRKAIDNANTNAIADTIIFNIPKSDPNFDASKGIWVIKPDSSFASILNSNLVIDGTSQSLFIGEDTNPEGPEIVIDGSNAGENTYGLIIFAVGTEIYRLTINRFGMAGISVSFADSSIISGCYIGTDYSGMKSAGNRRGITLEDRVNNTHIGPSSFLDKPNVISGNKGTGIFIVDSAQHNTIVGNYIGVNKNATDTIGNYLRGIDLSRSADNNIIKGNFIGGNYQGVYVNSSNYNVIKNNFIGTNKTWEFNFNNSDGILIFNNSKGNEVIENTIGYNNGWGIKIAGNNSIHNKISRNSISKNWNFGIINYDGGNTELTPPVITSVINSEIIGTTGANQIIEVFADSSDEGQVYIDSTVSDASGNFLLSISKLPDLPNITATARDALGNTSEFSNPFIVTGIEKEGDKIPTEYALYQNYPNPFNPVTVIKYTIGTLLNPTFADEGNIRGVLITLKVYDILGKEAAILINRFQKPGRYEVNFNASELPSGVYFYRLKTKYFSQTKKMLLLK